MSISRLARNTMDMNGEMLLTILSSLTQQESILDKYQIKLMAIASRDLDDIYNYIAEEFKEIETAGHMADLLEDAILGLDEMPYRGMVRRVGAFENKSYRQLFVKNFTIVYRVDEKKIEK